MTGKVAVVTGGAGGLGRAIARRFAAEGACVCIADIDQAAAASAAAEIGQGAFGLELDVTSMTSIKALLAAIQIRSERVDVLVNSAGIFGLEPWLGLTERGFDTIFAINVKGLAFVTQAFAADMAKQRSGAIINITSASGRAGNPNSVFYSASKMAVISLTQSAARGLAASGIRVNAIAPGGIETPMWETVRSLYSASGMAPDGDLDAQLEKAIPLGRLSTPLDHVGAAVFFASDDSAYVTGQTLNVDGGLVLN